ncbi:MAG: hypothetical protein K5765_06820 [Clostridia bacterium]|nr:hypothetical protein [Clostridia bacterium]
MEEQKEKKTFKEWYNAHPKTVFGVRLSLWIVFAAVLPFIFIAWRYGIFHPSSKIKLTGWGIIAIIIVLVFIITLIRYLYKGLKPGLFKQCITGFITIILPLTILLLFVVEIENHIVLVKQALIAVIVCELIGIPLNPMPDWLEKRRIEQGKEKVERISDIVLDKFFQKKKENE